MVLSKRMLYYIWHLSRGTNSENLPYRASKNVSWAFGVCHSIFQPLSHLEGMLLAMFQAWQGFGVYLEGRRI